MDLIEVDNVVYGELVVHELRFVRGNVEVVLFEGGSEDAKRVLRLVHVVRGQDNVASVDDEGEVVVKGVVL